MVGASTDTRLDPWTRRWRGLLVLGFLLTIFVPPLVGLLGIQVGSRLTEKRIKASLPALPRSHGDLNRFPKRFDAYYKDHFGLRDLLIRSHHWIRRNVFHISPVPEAIRGKEGWLFLAKPATDYQAMRPWEEEKLEAWLQALLGYQRRLEARGIPFVFVVAPNKHTVYPEYLPNSARAVWTESPLDQLLEYLRQNSDLHVVDLRPSILAAKAEGKQVYFRYDTHWSPEGDYAAYRGLIEGLATRFPEYQPLPREAFTREEVIRPYGDLSVLMGMRNATEPYVDMEIENSRAVRHSTRQRGRPVEFNNGRWRDIYQNSSQQGRALMLVDSFGLQLEPHMAEHFQRIVFLPGVLLQDEVLDLEKPDLVILQMVERYLASDNQLYYLKLGQVKRPAKVYSADFESGELDLDKGPFRKERTRR